MPAPAMVPQSKSPMSSNRTSLLPGVSLDCSLALPPDSYAAHVNELPKPGTQLLDCPTALALGLRYNAMDPDARREIENLREDLSELAVQNENLDAYSRLIYDAACRSQRQVSELMKQIQEARTERMRIGTTSGEPGGPSGNIAEHAHETGNETSNETLRVQLSDARSEVQEAHQRLDSILDKHALLSAEAGTLRAQLQDTVRALEAVKEERSTLESQLRHSEKTATALETRCRIERSDLESVRGELEMLKAERGVDQVKMNDLNSRLDDAQAAQSAHQLCQTERDDLRSERDRLRTELEERGRRAAVETSVLASERRALQREIEELSLRHSEFETERGVSQNQISGLTEDRDHLRSELDAGRVQLVHLGKELDTLKSIRAAEEKAQAERLYQLNQRIHELSAERAELYRYLFAAHELVDNLKENALATRQAI